MDVTFGAPVSLAESEKLRLRSGSSSSSDVFVSSAQLGPMEDTTATAGNAIESIQGRNTVGFVSPKQTKARLPSRMAAAPPYAQVSAPSLGHASGRNTTVWRLLFPFLAWSKKNRSAAETMTFLFPILIKFFKQTDGRDKFLKGSAL